MSTATPPIRPAAPAPSPRPGPAPAAPAGVGLTIDPVRLLKKYYPLLVAAAVLGAMMGAAAHFALLRVHPTYTAAATFECVPPVTDIYKGVPQQVGTGDFDRFMGTQMALMTSYAVLSRTLENPDVQSTAWAKQFYVNGAMQPQLAQPALADDLAPRIIPTTNLIRLSMSWRNPDDVKTIVDAATTAFMEDVRRNAAQQTVARREVLDRQRRNLTEEIDRLTRLRSEAIQNGRLTSRATGESSEETSSRQLSDKLVEVSQALAQRKALIERYEDMLRNNSVIQYTEDMVEIAKRDPVVTTLANQLSDLETSEQTLLSRNFGESHPDVVAVRKRREATKQQYDDKMQKALRSAFDAQLEMWNTDVKSLTAQQTKFLKDLDAAEKRRSDMLRTYNQIDQWEKDLARATEELALTNQSRAELELRSNNAVFDQVRVVMPAQRPNQVSFPKLGIMLPLGVLLLTGLTAGVVLLREVMDQRVRGPADLAMIPRLRILGIVPDASEDPARPPHVETAFRDTPGGVVTESFRQIRAPLVKKMDQHGMRTLLVLAGMPGSGATTVLSNLALASAAADERVLIIDGNVRRPGLHKVFGIAEGLGLGDCLAGHASLDQAVRPTSVANVSVLTAGTPGNRMVPERLGAESMSRLLAEAAQKFDRVFVDAPPAIVSGDGISLANRCDGVVLVVRALQEKRGLVSRLRAQLSEAHAELLGVIVNGVRPSAGGYFKGNIKATHEYQTKGR